MDSCTKGKNGHVKLLLVNGPNLNLLGTREPEIYGSQTLADIVEDVRREARQFDCDILDFHSNHEGAILDFIHEHAASSKGLIINPGALTHYSYALRDALELLTCPVVEVHLSQTHAREPFRRHSVVSPVATVTITGAGAFGYRLAVQAALDLLRRRGDR